MKSMQWSCWNTWVYITQIKQLCNARDL